MAGETEDEKVLGEIRVRIMTTLRQRDDQWKRRWQDGRQKVAAEVNRGALSRGLAGGTGDLAKKETKIFQRTIKILNKKL